MAKLDEEITSAKEFSFAPLEEKNLFRINAGLSRDFALSRAELLHDYVRRRLQQEMDGAPSPDVAIHYDDLEMICFMLDMADALRHAAGAKP